MLRGLLRSLPPFLLLVLLFLQSGTAMRGVYSGLVLWAESVLPALLPFYTTADLLLQCGTLRHLSPLMRPLCRLLRLPDDVGGLLLSSWLSGAPNGARLLAQVCDNPAVCTRFCACATVTGPLFLIGTAGQLLNHPALGALIYGIHLLAALCSGLIWRNYGDLPSAAVCTASAAQRDFLTALPEALRSSSLALLFIGGAIAFFSALTAVFQSLGVFPALQHILSAVLPADAVSALLSGFFEVSQGTVSAAQGQLSLPLKLSLICALASFGGISVLCQAKVFLQGRVRTSVYLLQRLTHAALSAALCRGLCFAAGSVLPTAAIIPPAPVIQPAQSFPWLFPLLCLFFCILPHNTKGR